jgi:hypothetical protein
MIRYVLLLCLLMVATLYTLGGRTDAPLRDGLAGKLPPLVSESPAEPVTRPADLAAVQQAPAPSLPKAAPAPASAAPVVRPSPEQAGSSVISAAFAKATAESGSGALAGQSLTLALPLADAEAPRSAASTSAVEPPTGAEAAPTVQYVMANTVNVRTGPSADTKSLTKLDRGEAVMVLPSDTPGWSMIRIEGDGLEGYIASRFLGDPPQDGIFTPVN